METKLSCNVLIPKLPKMTPEEKREKALKTQWNWQARSRKKMLEKKKKPISAYRSFYSEKEWKDLAIEIKKFYLIRKNGILGWSCWLCGDFIPQEYSRDAHCGHMFPRETNRAIELDKRHIRVICKYCNKGYDRVPIRIDAALEKLFKEIGEKEFFELKRLAG